MISPALDRAIATDFSIMALAGRCANGSELDHGSLFHVVNLKTGRALCTARPGRRSVGWVDPWNRPQQISCMRCFLRAQKGFAS